MTFADTLVSLQAALDEKGTGGYVFVKKHHLDELLHRFHQLGSDARIEHEAKIAAIAQARREAYADAPSQPDVQEAVIKKLDLVANEAVEKARKEAAQRCAEIGKEYRAVEAVEEIRKEFNL